MSRLLILATVLLFCRPAWALNGGLIELAHGNDLNRVHIAVISNMDKRWLPINAWHVAGHWEAGVGAIESRHGKSAITASLTPVLRLRPNGSASTQPYLEGGVGLLLLTQDRLDAEHDFSSHALLAELLGMGITFGDRSQYDLGYRLNNLGNLNGKNAQLHSLRLTYSY